jgi:hypothetical protein
MLYIDWYLEKIVDPVGSALFIAFCLGMIGMCLASSVAMFIFPFVWLWDKVKR